MQLITFESTKDLICGCLYFWKSHIICTLKLNIFFHKNLIPEFHQWAEQRIDPPLSHSSSYISLNLCSFLSVCSAFLTVFKAKNVWRSATFSLIRHNCSPSDLPINCSWYSALLGTRQSTSLYNCCKRLHILVTQRTGAHWTLPWGEIGTVNTVPNDGPCPYASRPFSIPSHLCGPVCACPFSGTF